MRDVEFDEVAAFLGELKEQKDHVSYNIVLCEVIQEEINSGKSRVFVEVGFCIADQRIRLLSCCGDAILGGDNEEASKLTADTVLEIEQICDLLNLKFRRGTYQ